jgi:hypothetical protein
MAGIDTGPARRGGSRVAGYVLATLLGAPLVSFAVVFILRSPGLAVAAGLTAIVVGLTFAFRAWSDDRNARLPD